MKFHDGVTEEKLIRALERNPDGVARLAAFLGKPELAADPEALARACRKHRAEEVFRAQAPRA